jgi:hypothetical protein
MDTQSHATTRKQYASAPRRRFIEPVRYKTRMCRHYETTGQCPYYPRCAFAHGPMDMRSVATNANQGITHISRLREFQDRLCASQDYAGATSPDPYPVEVDQCPPPPVEGVPSDGTYIPGCQCPECMYESTYTTDYYGRYAYDGVGGYPPMVNGTPPLAEPNILAP